MLKKLFVPYLLIEVLFAFLFIRSYGFFGLFVEVVISAIFGVFLMLKIGFFQFMQRAIFLKPSDIFGTLGVAIGGFLLFLPGVLSDFLGVIVLVLSFLSNLKSQNHSDARRERFDFSSRQSSSKSSENSEIIDVEVIEESKSSH